jgi:hypothetical protein
VKHRYALLELLLHAGRTRVREANGTHLVYRAPGTGGICWLRLERRAKESRKDGEAQAGWAEHGWTSGRKDKRCACSILAALAHHARPSPVSNLTDYA